MGRPLAEHYRRLAVGLLAQYGGKDHRVTRDVIGWLVAGPESQRTGVMRIHTGAIADDLGWTRAQVDAAIARLSADGQAVWSPEVRVIACRFVLDVLGISTTNHKTSAVNQIAALPDCEATRYALEVVKAREIKGEDGALNAPRNAPRNAPSHGAANGAEKREERREKREEKSSPYGELPVAAAPVTGWTIPTQPFAGAHFAVMPEALVEPCILAGCPACGTVLDPFAGSGTVGSVARRLGREFVGAELNPDYADMARKRIAETQPPLFAP